MHALYLVAAGLGVACLLLALWGWRAGRQLEQQMHRAAAAQAELLANEYTAEVARRTNASAERIFVPLLMQPGPYGLTHLRDLQDSVAAAVACDCIGALAVTDGLFAWNSDQPDSLVTLDVPPERQEAMRRGLVQMARGVAERSVAAALLRRDGDGREILAPAMFQERDGRVRIIGFFSDPRLLASVRLIPAAQAAQYGRFGEAGAAIASWRVTTSSGDTLVRLGEWSPDEAVLSAPLMQPQFTVSPARSGEGATSGARDYQLLLQIHPRPLADHLYGGSGGSPLPTGLLLMGTLTLCGAMVLLARRLVTQVREREAFATAVAHDLRTPLTQILLYGESLQLDRPALQSRHDAARIIVRETRRLIHLVEHALRFTGRHGARPTLQLEGLDLSMVVDEVLTGLEPLVARAHMSIAWQRRAPVTARADRHAVVQVLTNLVENALRFGPAGQVIRVSVTPRDEWAELAVEDQGSGIALGDRERVFAPFVHDRSSPGAGVGLAVSRQLAELMDGTLIAGQAVGGGARLVLRLPRHHKDARLDPT